MDYKCHVSKVPCENFDYVLRIHLIIKNLLRFLKSVDRFNDLVVSVYVTAGHTRLMLLHDSRNEDGIKSFFQEVHELYIKILLNPLYLPGSRITSSHFDTKVRALARKYL
ncbi:Longin-like domain superfamily [Arabidopsis suecica]|uniref:Longin-like domain superfamily n=1 Tax=Arabidopsis suecica TaxID=45249 RepID=A0A8T2BV65_ARASU|nr:Longin-like domain superfamily [Arabidopsis suecica]